MMDRMTLAAVCCGVLMLSAGGVSAENTASKGNSSTPPEPGTRAYYEQYIRGSCILDGGVLIRVGTSGVPALPTAPGVIRAPREMLTGVQILEGRALQVLSNNVVVLGKPITNASGMVAYPLSCLVSMAANRQPATGVWLRIPAMTDGSYTYVTGSGTGGSLPAYREVPEPTYEEYRQIYERDCQAASDEPLVSAVPVTNAAPVAVSPSSTSPTAPAGGALAEASGSAPPTSLSFAQRIRQRREELLRMRAAATNTVPDVSSQDLDKKLRDYNMELIKAKGTKGPPLPISLTPDEDAQLVKEGVLPPQ